MKALSQKTAPFVWIALVLILFKILIAVLFPVIGDEAYYYYWGRHFAGGYYDLSPMIGWWEAFFTSVSLQSWWLRVPNFLVISLVTFAMKEWLTHTGGANAPFSKNKANLISALYFFSPLPFLAVLISPDVPLVLFSFLSAFCFYQAVARERGPTRYLQFFLAGALWGAALLSKYFAFFLLPAFGLWFLFRRNDSSFWKRPWAGLLVFALGALPFLFQHLHWNATHCWANFVFNFVTRQNVVDGPVYQTFGLYLVYLVILATPILLRDVSFRDSSVPVEVPVRDLRSFVLFCWIVPISLFGITALKARGQGLHWYFSYVPFFFMWVGLSLSESKLQARLNTMLKATSVLTLLAAVSLIWPDQTLKFYFKNHFTSDYQFSFHSREWVEKIEPHLADASAVMSDNYSMSSVLDHQLQRYFRDKGESFPVPTQVWGDGSRFGRFYDWTLDVRSLEGKKVVIVTRGDMSTPRWKTYFRELKVFPIQVGSGELQSTFYVSEGYGFHALKFHKEVTKIAIDLYYPPLQSSFFNHNSLFPVECSLRN